MDEGKKKNMNSQGWDTNMERGDNCWKNIKISLTEINIAMKRRYRTNMRHVKPLQSCHRNDMDNWCKNCYHYKQMKQFVRIIWNQKRQPKNVPNILYPQSHLNLRFPIFIDVSVLGLRNKTYPNHLTSKQIYVQTSFQLRNYITDNEYKKNLKI